MPLPSTLLSELTNLRHHLHKNPELSGKEKKTSATIIKFLETCNPTSIISEIGGFGVAAVFDSGTDGPTLLLRADIDALPIQEESYHSYQSINRGVAHLCGHDGHTSILLGVAKLAGNSKPKKGKLVLLFQPAEETGEGAAKVIHDEKFSTIKPDIAYALHNLPGFEKGTVFYRQGTFASASTGVIVTLKGLPSHAAHPENGNNPDLALAKIILQLNEITKTHNFDQFTLLTVIHAKLGEVAFGTTPGNAVVMATLRTYLDTDMSKLKQLVESCVKTICDSTQITFELEYTEEFPATINNSQCVDILLEVCEKEKIGYQKLNNPFRWSEDFGHFSNIYNSAFFGIGSGLNHPQLHNENYDFPDEIIESAVKIMVELTKFHLG
ncbi:MAG TPA: amidohydrolase [Tenuifilaceae bacterium]|nr:amidohydrolase [Tenuifilaceae bacterium]